MVSSKEPAKREIPVSLVERMMREQFPLWANLPIEPVKSSGWDNKTFHLGKDMLIRMPSAERYAHQVIKEHKWLPKLAHQLSVPIPRPLALGKPSADYAWNWSVYEWIKGETANLLESKNQNIFAEDTASFLLELHCVDTIEGPTPDGFFRGSSPKHYDFQTREAVAVLTDILDPQNAISVWEAALDSEWDKKPVWVHGDFSIGNILVDRGRLAAVIDFGSCCVGDPSCDLVLAWTFLNEPARNVFKRKLDLDESTWARARGWALWKALITLVGSEDRASTAALHQLKIINIIIKDHQDS